MSTPLLGAGPKEMIEIIIFYGGRMNLKEALQALIDGKKIRHVDWTKHSYAKLDDGYFSDG